MELSRTQRWILANQYKILEHVDPADADYYARAREALESGYELQYEDIAASVYRDEEILSSQECSEVVNTMAMHDALQRSYDALDDKAGIDEYYITFQGYDGNDETKYMGYARYFCNDGERFGYLRLEDDGFNSHMTLRPQYQAMLRVWKRFDSSYQLTKDQIQEIIGAR